MAEKKKVRLLRSISYFVLLLLVIYVLSIGPAYAFLLPRSSGVESRNSDLLHSFYHPVWWSFTKVSHEVTNLPYFLLVSYIRVWHSMVPESLTYSDPIWD